MNPPTGCAIWLYGSAARGDTDRLSDIDIFSVDATLDALETATRAFPKAKLSISRYSRQEVTQMATYGSLFLWHVHLEGRPLHEEGDIGRQVRHLLDKLPPYARTNADIAAFQTAVSDVVESLQGGGSPLFEAAALAMVIRHAAILGTYALGTPEFRRDGAIKRLAALLELPQPITETLARLQIYRLVEEGRSVSLDVPSRDSVLGGAQLVKRVLDMLKRRVDVATHAEAS